MDLIVDPLGHAFFIRALLAATIVGIVCAVIGTFIVLRGLAFMGDAVSHAAFPGVVVAYIVGGGFYLGAAIAAVATALAIGEVSRRARIRTDTAIGVLFAGMFALGIFLYSTIEGYVGDLNTFLFGSLLSIGPDDLVALAALAAVVLGLVGAFWKELLYSTFDPLGAGASGLPVARLESLLLVMIALAVVVSLQAVGIILVVAMLVTPAATAQLVTVRFGRLMVTAALIGVASAIIGLYVSYWLDVASGATIVLTQTVIFATVLLLGPRTGLLARTRPGSIGPEPSVPSA
jgi:ABC-type Mn2+/Zn2+ transport system permease subunit